MNIIDAIFAPILLVLILIVCFGKMGGVQAERIATSYLRIVGRIFFGVAEMLFKFSLPLLRLMGAKILYVTNHYLAEQKKQKLSIMQEENKARPIYIRVLPPENARTNPYDTTPKPEIKN